MIAKQQKILMKKALTVIAAGANVNNEVTDVKDAPPHVKYKPTNVKYEVKT